MPVPRNLGIIGSSGGSALAAASQCLADAGQKQSWCVVTDRDCGMSSWAKSHASALRRIDYQEPTLFSEDALSFFLEHKVAAVLLFYTRIVTQPLIDALPTFNIHPSLLPAFPGMGSVKRAVHAGSDRIGATLHVVDANLDTGPILLQVASAIGRNCTIEYAEHISYIQKVWLTLRWREIVIADEPASAARRLPPRLAEAFQKFQKGLGYLAISVQDA